MKIETAINQNNYSLQKKRKDNENKPAFRGPIDAPLTSALAMLDTNPTANAVLLDLGSMVIPRSCIDAKRNKYAGAETFTREFTSTFITCLSAGVFAVGISKLANKFIDKKTKINTSSWFTKDGIDTIKEAWNESGKEPHKYVTNILDNISGLEGKETKSFKNINWEKVEWFDTNKWENIKWKDKKYKGIENKLTTREGIINTLSEIMTNKNIDKKDAKNILNITETRITNALGVNREIKLHIKDKTFNTSMGNLLRDAYDMGKDIFFNDKADSAKIFKKIAKINKVKAYGALTLSSLIGLTAQRINRKITEKRTGHKGFVGTTDYNNKTVNQQNNTPKESKTKLFVEKAAACAGIIGLALGVMKVKSAKDFAKKLEFTGPVSTGNAIKTVYTSTLVGRFMASDDSTELRETACRDYLGFLNWLVLGGFAAKGTANLLDKKRETLFNETNTENNKKGTLQKVKHWLGDVKLKTHAEIAAKGSDYAKKNLWKLNAAHCAGLIYSTVMLGVAVPLMNIMVTNRKKRKENAKNVYKNS